MPPKNLGAGDARSSPAFFVSSGREKALPLNESGACRGGCESPTQGTEVPTVKSSSASPGSAIPGTILLDALYTTEELMLRLGWSAATLEAAHCRGLRLYHLGGSSYVYGRDVLDFLRTVPKGLAESNGDGTPAPCTPDVAQPFADEAWAKAQGCCEVCNAPAFIVTRTPEISRPVVLCQHHAKQEGRVQ
jgi:hypothetical protein